MMARQKALFEITTRTRALLRRQQNHIGMPLIVNPERAVRNLLERIGKASHVAFENDAKD